MGSIEHWAKCGDAMIRVDAMFFYQVGASIRPLTAINYDMDKFSVLSRLYPAETWLDGLLSQGLVRIKTAAPKGRELLETVRRLQREISELQGDKNAEQIGAWDAFLLKSQAEEFQTLLGAELSFGDIYVVSPKGGFDTTILAEYGLQIFPSALPTKVPDTIADARDAARCIAFELPTSAAFHMHRVNEIVLRRYYDHVTGGKPSPERRLIPKYIDAMKGYQVGDPIVFGALATLNSLHRNPVIHPEQRLENIEEAIALYGSVNSVVSYMLKALPPAPLELIPPPSQETPAIEDKTTEAKT